MKNGSEPAAKLVTIDPTTHAAMPITAPGTGAHHDSSSPADMASPVTAINSR